MPKPRIRVNCPWCGAKLERIAKSDRIKEKRPQGSRIEKNVAKCPECSRIVILPKAGTPPTRFRRLAILGACAMVLTVAVGVIALLYWTRT